MSVAFKEVSLTSADPFVLQLCRHLVVHDEDNFAFIWITRLLGCMAAICNAHDAQRPTQEAEMQTVGLGICLGFLQEAAADARVLNLWRHHFALQLNDVMSNVEKGLANPMKAAEETPELLVLKRNERLASAVTLDLTIRHGEHQLLQARTLMEENMKW